VSEGQSSRIPHVTALDGVRGVAVAGVLLFHAGHLQGGYLGVDLFFVLSGYLITSLLLAEQRSRGQIALGSFWARRARRLLPALAILLLGVAFYAWFVAQPSDLDQIRVDGLATLAYVANWRYVFEHFSYWSLFTSPSPLQHTWSLAIEEQFYLIWPPVVAGIIWISTRRRSRWDVPHRVLVVAATGAIASGVWAVVLYNLAGANRVYYGTDTRAAAILLGASLAALVRIHGPARTRSGRISVEVAGLIGALVLAVAWLTLPGTSSVLYEGGLFACSLAGAAVLAAVIQPSAGPLAVALRTRPLVLLGIISYGVYLYHWPIYLWLEQRSSLHGWVLFSVEVTVTLAVATVSYFVVEQPIRRGRLHIPHLRVLVPAAVVVVVAALVVGTIGYRPASATVSGNDSLSQALKAAGSSNGQLRLLTVGNSVSFFLAREGFEQLHTRPSLLVLNAAHADCTYPPGTTAISFDPTNPSELLPASGPCDRLWSLSVREFRPNVVFFTIGDLLAWVRHGTQWVHPCMPAFDDWFATSLRQAVDTLTQDGAHMVIATSAYSEFYEAPTQRWAWTDCLNRVEKAVGAGDARVTVVDLGQYVCPSMGHCRETIDGAPMRADGIHYRGRSAIAIASWLLANFDLPKGAQPTIARSTA
jgi:peptidoglycan/LPS O-acetylase OafA/YrhL